MDLRASREALVEDLRWARGGRDEVDLEVIFTCENPACSGDEVIYRLRERPGRKRLQPVNRCLSCGEELVYHQLTRVGGGWP